VTRLAEAAFVGAWLGLLDAEQLSRLDEHYYAGQEVFRNDAHNLRGLFAWEQQAVARHFQDRRSIVVAAVGGGREAIALQRLGYQVDSFESHPRLVDAANALLARESLHANVKLAPRDHCPSLDGPYDGAIVGWGAYALIHGRERRVGFLRELADELTGGSPLLLSFFARSSQAWYFTTAAQLANVIRRLRGAARVELGDDLSPNFVHHFTREELERELGEAGFRLFEYSATPYGHGVARRE
jgi:hypothetical protein